MELSAFLPLSRTEKLEHLGLPQHSCSTSLPNLSLNLGVSTKMAFLLNKTSVVSHFRSHISPGTHTTSLLYAILLPSTSFSFDVLCVSLFQFVLCFSLVTQKTEDTPRIPHWTRASRESRESLSSILLKIGFIFLLFYFIFTLIFFF